MKHRKEEDDLYRKFAHHREEEDRRIREEFRVRIFIFNINKIILYRILITYEWISREMFTIWKLIKKNFIILFDELIIIIIVED